VFSGGSVLQIGLLTRHFVDGKTFICRLHITNNTQEKTMSSPYEVLPEHIGRLRDIDLQHLLGILLWAESRKTKVANIHAPLCVDVPDGGEDGLWEGESAVAPFIPAPKTLYQTKATDVGPADCKTEIIKPRPFPAFPRIFRGEPFCNFGRTL